MKEWFETRTRTSGESFVTLKDDAPEWLMSAVRDAHQDDLPNDWIFAECQAAAEAISDGSLTEDDDLWNYADSRIDIYTNQVFAWAASQCTSGTWSHAEEAAEEFGSAGTIVGRIQHIQHCAIEYIAGVMLHVWEARRKEGEPDDC